MTNLAALSPGTGEVEMNGGENGTPPVRRRRAWFTHPLVVGTGALTAGQYAATAIGMGATVVAANGLGAEGFGASSLAIAYPFMVWGLSTAKPVTIATRYLSRFRAAKAVAPFVAVCQLSCLLDITAAAVAVAIVALTANWVASGFYRLPHLAGVMLAYAALFPLASLSGTSQAILTSAQRFRTLGVLRVLRAMLLLSLTAASIASGAGLLGYVLTIGTSHVAAALMEAAAALSLIRREHGLRLRDMMRSRLGELSSLKGELQSLFGWNYVLTTVTSLGDNGLILLLGAYAGASESGYFRLATTLIVGARITEASMAKVVYPTLVGEWGGGAYSGALRARLSRWTWRGGMPSALCVTAGLLLLPVLVPILFGEEYVPMVFGTQMMLVAVALRALVFWLEPAFYAAGAIKLWARLHLVQAMLILGCGWPLVAYFGFFGGAIAFALGMIATSIMSIGFFISFVLARREQATRSKLLAVDANTF